MIDKKLPHEVIPPTALAAAKIAFLRQRARKLSRPIQRVNPQMFVKKMQAPDEFGNTRSADLLSASRVLASRQSCRTADFELFGFPARDCDEFVCPHIVGILVALLGREGTLRIFGS